MTSEEEKTKQAKQVMIKEIQEELIIYFRKGRMNPRSFFELADVQFQNMEEILKIHFILSDDVKDYILKLKKNIRSIKNSTILEKKLFRGEVRGKIDWNKTIEHRNQRQNTDRVSFVTDNVDKFFETKENIILKRAISILYNIFHKEVDLEHIKRRDWFTDGEKMSKIIAKIYQSNVYIKKMQTEGIKISDKMISDVSKSRNEIYRDSAKIVRLYREIMSLDQKHMENLFQETFIEMADVNEVFELYCIFNYLRSRFKAETLTYQIIDQGKEFLASVEDEESIYRVYHDLTASKYLNFNVKKSELRKSENSYIKRKLKALDRKEKIMIQLGKNSSSSFWTGRPDLIILKLNKREERIEEVEIGEIKYTNDMGYLATGLEELLEYIYLVKDQNNYIKQDKIKGLLFVNHIELPKTNFHHLKIINREKIKKLGTNDLSNEFSTTVKNE